MWRVYISQATVIVLIESLGMWLAVIGLILVVVALVIVKFKKPDNNQHQKSDDRDSNRKDSVLSDESQPLRKSSEDSITDPEAKLKQKSKSKKETDPGLDVKDPQFLGNLKLPGIQAFDIQHSKLLVSTSNGELHLYDLKQFRKDNPTLCRKGYQQLENNIGSAVWAGSKYLYVALSNDKTVAFYQFVGQNGIYFRLVNKLQKQLHSGPILGVHTTEEQQFILTVGSDADTTIKVWSPKGDKLQEVNTSQVKHYSSKFLDGILCLRSWSPSFKLFKVNQDKKTSSFVGIEKSLEMSHQDGVLDGSIDILGNNGVTIRKGHSVCVWRTDYQQKASHKRKQTTLQSLPNCERCEVHSISTDDGRIQTLVAFSDGRTITLTSLDLAIKKTFRLPDRQKDDISQVRLVGRKSLVLFGVTKKIGRVYMWNVTEIICSMEKHPL